MVLSRLNSASIWLNCKGKASQYFNLFCIKLCRIFLHHKAIVIAIIFSKPNLGTHCFVPDHIIICLLCKLIHSNYLCMWLVELSPKMFSRNNSSTGEITKGFSFLISDFILACRPLRMGEDVGLLLFSSALGFFTGSIIKYYDVTLDSMVTLTFDTLNSVLITKII